MRLNFKKNSSKNQINKVNSKFELGLSESSLDYGYSFRRNKTLSETRPSSNKEHQVIKSSRLKLHNLIKKRKSLSFLLLAFIAATIVSYYLLSQFTANVQLRTENITIGLDNSYEHSIQKYFTDNPIQRLSIFFDLDKFNNYIQTELPEVESISLIGSNGLGKTNMELTMRRPIASWNVNGDQRYVDINGVSFKRNYFAEPTIKIINNISDGSSSDIQNKASNRVLSFIGILVGLIKESGYDTSQISIPEDMTRQIDIRLTGLNYPIKFSIDRPAGEQAEDMTRTIEFLKSKAISPSYVDLRVSGKAFYK
mgnify:CR=1 FL=1